MARLSDRRFDIGRSKDGLMIRSIKMLPLIRYFFGRRHQKFFFVFVLKITQTQKGTEKKGKKKGVDPENQPISVEAGRFNGSISRSLWRPQKKKRKSNKETESKLMIYLVLPSFSSTDSFFIGTTIVYWVLLGFTWFYLFFFFFILNGFERI